MKTFKTIAAGVVLGMLSACGTVGGGPAFTAESIVQSGDAPSAEQGEMVARSYLQQTLKDPDSLKQFRMTGGPILTSWYQGLISGGGTAYGWAVCFEYNAKNSYGGYTGVKGDTLVLRQAGNTFNYVPSVNWGTVTAKC